MKRILPPLNALKAFEAVAQTGSFTLAAEQLGVTQSAMSRQVKQLEILLGKPLLERHRQQLILTETGRALLPVLQQSFDNIDTVMRHIANQTDLQQLYINVPPTFAVRWLLPRLAELHQLYPNLDIAIGTEVEDSLSHSSELDFAVRFGDGQWPDLYNELILQEQHILVCSPKLLSLQPSLHDSLEGATLLNVLRKGKAAFATWKHWFAVSGVNPPERSNNIEFDTLNLVIEGALNGLGIAIADKHMIIQELNTGNLKQLHPTPLAGTQSYWFTCRPGQEQMPHIKRVKDWLMADRHTFELA